MKFKIGDVTLMYANAQQSHGNTTDIIQYTGDFSCFYKSILQILFLSLLLLAKAGQWPNPGQSTMRQSF